MADPTTVDGEERSIGLDDSDGAEETSVVDGQTDPAEPPVAAAVEPDDTLSELVTISCALAGCRSGSESIVDVECEAVKAMLSMTPHLDGVLGALSDERNSRFASIDDFLSESQRYLLKSLMPSAIRVAVSRAPSTPEDLEVFVNFMERCLRVVIAALPFVCVEHAECLALLFGVQIADPLADSPERVRQPPGQQLRQPGQAALYAGTRASGDSLGFSSPKDMSTEYARHDIPPSVLSPILLHIVNFFGLHGGFTALLCVIKSRHHRLTIDALQKLLETVVTLRSVLHPSFKQLLAQSLSRVTFAFFLDRDPEFFKSSNIQDVANVVGLVEQMLVSVQPQSSPVRSIVEPFWLDFLIDLFRSPYLDKRIFVLNEIGAVCMKLVARDVPPVRPESTVRAAYNYLSSTVAGRSPNETASRPPTPSRHLSIITFSWISPGYLCQWILQNNILSEVFAGHDEVIRRSVPLIKFLHSQGALEFSHLQELWRIACDSTHHQSKQHIAYRILSNIMDVLNREQLNCLLDLFSHKAVTSYDVPFLSAVESATTALWHLDGPENDADPGGLQLLWTALFDGGNSCSNETLEAFVRLLSNSSGERFRMRVLEDCIRNLQTGDNVATTCTIIKRIICLYPSSASWLNSVVGASSSRRSVIELLETNYSLLDTVLETLARSTGSETTDHIQSLVVFYVSSSLITLKRTQLDRLWTHMVENAASSEKPDSFFTWLRETCELSTQNVVPNTSPVFSDTDLRYLLMDKILHQLPASALSEPAFSLIEFLFVTVGCRIGWLKYRSTGSRQKLYSANLEPVHTALDYLFEVSVCHKVPKIANRAREIVAELLGSSANQDALYSWFVKRCLSNCDDSQHLALLSSILQARSEVLSTTSLPSPVRKKIRVVPDDVFGVGAFSVDLDSSISVMDLWSAIHYRLVREGIGIGINDIIVTLARNGTPITSSGEPVFTLGIADNDIFEVSRAPCALARYSCPPAGSQFSSTIPEPRHLPRSELAESAKRVRTAYIHKQRLQNFVSQLYEEPSDNIVDLSILDDDECYYKLFQMESDDAWTVLSLLPLHSKTLALIDNLEGHFEEIFAPTTPFQMLYALNICIAKVAQPTLDASWVSSFVERMLGKLIELMLDPLFTTIDPVVSLVFQLVYDLYSLDPDFKSLDASGRSLRVASSPEFLTHAANICTAALVRSFPHEAIADESLQPIAAVHIVAVSDQVAVEATRLLAGCARTVPDMGSMIRSRTVSPQWVEFVSVQLRSRDARLQCCSALFAIGLTNIDLTILPMLRAQPLQVTPDGDICGRGDPPESLFERNAVAGPYCIDALLLFAAEPSVDPTSLEKTWDFLESRIVRYDPDIDMEDWRCDDDLAVIRCLRRIVSAQKLPFLDDNSWTSHVLRLIKSRVLALPRRARRLKESDLGRRDIRIGVMSLVLDIVALQAPRTAFDVVHLLAHLPEWGFHGGTPLASYHPSQWERAPTTPVGLKNQGATCYMNSFLQLLFSTASFREGILSEPIADPPVSHPDQLLAELKVVFGQLLASHRKWHDPVSLCQALRDDMGEFLNNWNEQKDVHEFANSIMDQLLPDGQSHSRIGPTERDRMWGFRGCLVNQMISQECRHRSERLEPFFTASLTVANNANLAASLSLFVEGEVLETDNKWMCAECNQKVPAIKRTCFQASSLPEHLILHLKRFEYDFDAMRKFKINDYFEFPMEFSMLPFTDVGIDNTGDGSDDEYLYRLVGVLVHTGVADAGHYYMFGSHSDGRWFQWNDAVVTEFDVNQLPAECFGGVDPGGNMRPNSAYLLLYDRVLLAGKRRERVVSLAAVPSQVQNLVKVSNVQFAREKQLFDSRFMTWLWHLIDLSWPGLLRGYNSLHTRYAALDEPCDKGASDESELGLAESETGENCVALAMQYTTEVVIRSVDCSSFPYWLWLIQRMISVSKRAAVWVVHKVAEDMPWFRLFSMQFPIADGRCAFIDLVIGALQRVGADDPHVRQFLSNIVRDVLPSHTEVLRLLRGLSSLPGYADLLLSLNALDKVVGMLLKPDSLPAPGSWLDHVSYISTHLVHQCLNRNSSLPEALHQDKTWGYLLEDQITWTGQHVGRPFIAVAARIARATGADPFIKRAVAGLTISHTRRSFRLRLLSELVSDAIDTGSASTLDRILTRMMALMDQCLASGATHDALLLDCLHWTTTHAFSAGPVAAWLHDHPATWQRVASAIVSAGPSS